MSKKSITTRLLVEDNPGDARLLHEMFNDQGSHNTELTCVACMSEAEKHLAEHAGELAELLHAHNPLAQVA
jgi:CheY-like chemotaxis protein